ncbi:MAG: hypothetical protein IKM85_04810 [Bacteroidales bacterium]|nr:hypothetical protein [Bacteroidales bacterium]
MGNRLLKILLPLLVLVAIAIVVMRTEKSIDNMAPSEIQPFEFCTYVDSIAKADLANKPYAQAKDEYRRIYCLIETEKSIMVTDSAGLQQPLLHDTVALGCYKRLFLVYWPAFQDLAEGVFKTDWSKKTTMLDVIKAEATDLKQLVGCDLRNDSLTKYLSYVDDYSAASSFLSKISCSSKSKYEDLVAQKETYKKKYPLCNNKELVDRLNKVPETAQKKWKESVEKSVNAACGIIGLDEFLEEKTRCETKISEYNEKFPTKKLSDDKTTNKLNKQWYELLSDEVDEACLIDDGQTFLQVYSDLIKKINSYDTNANDLKRKLEIRKEQLYYNY